MFQHGKNGWYVDVTTRRDMLKHYRTAEQAESGKIVGVDPTTITAGMSRDKDIYSRIELLLILMHHSRRPKTRREDQEEGRQGSRCHQR